MEEAIPEQGQERDGPLDADGLTLQEYAIRHHLPLELVVERADLNRQDATQDYPPPRAHPSEQARAVLRALDWAGLVRESGDFIMALGEIRRLDLLLWDLQSLRDYGFRFRQEYSYSDRSHRVVAHNLLKAPRDHLRATESLRTCPVPPPDFMLSLAVLVAHVGELQAGYLFLPFASASQAQWAALELERDGIRLKELEIGAAAEGALLRTHGQDDTKHLLALLRTHLEAMPGVIDRFEQDMPVLTVCKNLVFDAAHFITDHPAKCSNLHGGRYSLNVKVRGRVDPATGCVIDYGYLKAVVSRRVIERFDHQNLNYAAPELAWRSSTEMLCIYIWEQLIDYLPGLTELELYETTQNWCRYEGPSLEAFQRRGSDPVLTHFQQDLAASPLRSLLRGAGG
ncbi:6-carboxytetrahydropterin synthase [Thiorhodococcus minor]|uniref:6-carboxy-5,6,7,8-tetrahydropterin synthase n=1 Tax=Thiorhodococcus minor TaxID=57489 RepID=A0A6M0K1L0_9GAMM|nr:6-carboxytetrahydropterin synthase [Thiorhodococcus minor]